MVGPALVVLVAVSPIEKAWVWPGLFAAYGSCGTPLSACAGPPRAVVAAEVLRLVAVAPAVAAAVRLRPLAAAAPGPPYCGRCGGYGGCGSG